MTPDVTCVIPTYQRRELVVRAVRSALSQSWDGLLEVLVVDDGSTDGTAEHLQATFGTTVQVLHQGNRGASAARNLGIRAAKGAVVAFLDSDDEWLPHRLVGDSGVQRLLQGDGLLSLCGSVLVGDGHDRPVLPRLLARDPIGQYLSLRHGVTATSCIAVQRGRLDGMSFDTALPVVEDLDLVLQALHLGRVHVSPLALVRRHRSPGPRLYAGPAVADGWERFARKWQDELDRRPDARARVWRHVVRVHRDAAADDSAVVDRALSAMRDVAGQRAAARLLAATPRTSAAGVLAAWSRLERRVPTRA